MQLYDADPKAIEMAAADMPRTVAVYLTENIRAMMRLSKHESGDYSAAARAAIINLLMGDAADPKTRRWLEQRERQGRPSKLSALRKAVHTSDDERVMLATRTERDLLRRALAHYITDNPAGDDLGTFAQDLLARLT